MTLGLDAPLFVTVTLLDVETSRLEKWWGGGITRSGVMLPPFSLEGEGGSLLGDELNEGFLLFAFGEDVGWLIMVSLKLSVDIIGVFIEAVWELKGQLNEFSLHTMR